MLLAKHEILSAQPSGMTPRRALTIGGVGLLHVAAIYAIVTGMATTALKQVERDIEVTTVEPTTPPKTVPLPPTPKIVQPVETTAPTVPPPDIVIETIQTPQNPINVAITPPNTLPLADSAPSGVSSTHTTPPYPIDARNQSHQGTVHLLMVVSAQGDVTSATVMESSGFPELDQAAVSWVISHWKYKPAMQGGVAMAGQTQAAVKFDLKLAGR